MLCWPRRSPCKSFEPIARRNSQILKLLGRIHREKLGFAKLDAAGFEMIEIRPTGPTT
jgi:hypothetical protein